MSVRPEAGFLILTADVHDLRGLMQQIIALEHEITPEGYEKLRQLIRKMDRLLSPGASASFHRRPPDDR